jgi:hypothetical protein
MACGTKPAWKAGQALFPDVSRCDTEVISPQA